MKYALIFLGLLMLAFISFNVIAGLLGASSDDETFVGISVLAIQNTAIITLLIYLISKQKKK